MNRQTASRLPFRIRWGGPGANPFAVRNRAGYWALYKGSDHF